MNDTSGDKSMTWTPPKEKTVLLKDKYVLVYKGLIMFVYGEPKLNWTIDTVDGVNAWNMGGVAVGVNDNYILFKQESNRKYDKDVWYVTLNKATGEEVRNHDGRPDPKVYGRFSRIKTDAVDGEL